MARPANPEFSRIATRLPPHGENASRGLPSGMSHIETAELPVLYVKAGCKACDEISGFLKEHGIGYREVDVSNRPSGLAEMEKLAGGSEPPVLDWHGRILAGLTTDELVPFLQSRDVKLEDS